MSLDPKTPYKTPYGQKTWCLFKELVQSRSTLQNTKLRQKNRTFLTEVVSAPLTPGTIRATKRSFTIGKTKPTFFGSATMTNGTKRRNTTEKQKFGVRSHLATTTQSFYVVNTTFEMGCMVTNFTVQTWRQKNNGKKASLSSSANRPLLSVSCDHDHPCKTSNYDKKTKRFVV